MGKDSISRCELFNKLATIPAPPEANEFKAKIYAVIQGMEAADRPQGEWIPCEERLPEEEGHYLVTFGAFARTINGEEVIFGDIDGSVSEIGYGCYERDIFWQPTAFGWYDLTTATPFDKRAIKAWMPLPKPWKGAEK